MFKLIDILGKTKQVEACESYMVRWKSVEKITTYSWHSYDQAEVFTTEELAKEFARSLREAFKLTKCEDLIAYIKITKN